MSLNYLAIDIGGTNVKYGLIDHAGNLIEKNQQVTVSTSLEDFLAQMRAIIKPFANQIKGVGISVPGKVNHQDETIYGGGALTFLDKINLPQALNLAVPVTVENDGKAAALAELWLGNLHDVKNGAAVVLGTGVGGGLVLNGELFSGTHFQAGELSFITYDPKLQFENIQGFRGSAVRMIERVARELNLANQHDGLRVFEAINQRQGPAWDIFETYATEVALLIHNVQAVVDLERVVIGGGISAQAIVAETIKTVYDKMLASNPVFANTLTPVEITASKFANDANLYGAIYHLLLTINGEVI